MHSIQCQAEIETRYAILIKECREAKQFRVDTVRHTERLVKEAEMHAEEKKGFTEVLDRMEKEKAEREAELGKAKRDYEDIVRESEERIIAKDKHIIFLEKDLKTSYAEVVIQKLRADDQTALVAQTKLDDEGAHERGRSEGTAQAKASYDKCFEKALPIIQDDIFTMAWGLAMDLLSIAPEDPRRTDIPLPSKQQA